MDANRLPQEKIFAVYPRAEESVRRLPELCDALLEAQRADWPMLREGTAALRQIATRELECRGFTIRVQYNPRRIVSTAAEIDSSAIRKRPCFLCVDNLPAEQKGILWHGSFILLPNPIPIFHRHCTAAYVEHTPQQFEPFLSDFLGLASDLGPDFTIFYNGPRCGASAPDHMHFQVCPSGAIPVQGDVADSSRLVTLRTIDGVSLAAVRNYGRGTLIMSGADRDACEGVVRRFFQVVKELCNEPEEPMMNIISWYENGKWTLVFFPRKRHRPSVYFVDDRVVVSPAAVDMGGLIITPVEKDFRTISAGLVESIYHEVAVTGERVETYVENM